MAVTQLRGNSQIMGNTVDLGRLALNFLNGTDWDITNGNNDATITGLALPVNSDDAATKGYVDSVATGLDVKDSCRLTTAAALPAYTQSGAGVGAKLTANANGALSVDGIAVALNDRILVKDGAAGKDNGIYKVTAIGDGSNPWELTRAIDADENAEVTAGLFTFIEAGNTLADTGWVLTTNNPITVDTTALAFTQFSGAGAYTAGDGLDLVGNQFSVDVTDIIDTAYGLTEASNNIQVNLASNGGLDFNAGAIEVDVTDIIDTSYGLTESGGDIRVNLEASGGLDFATGAIGVDVTDFIDTNYGLTESTNDIRVNLETAGAGTGGLQFVSGAIGINPDSETGATVVPINLTANGAGILVGNTDLYNNSGTLAIKADGINETHLDWGSGANQVDATSIPLDTGGTYGGSALNVQDALEEIEGQLPAGTFVFNEVKAITNGNPALPALSNIPIIANSERVYLNGLRQFDTDDYTINDTTGVITFTFNMVTGDKVVIDYLY